MDFSRLYREDADPLCTPLALDRQRIIESKSFRRLEYKTQVFQYGAGDHYRTRLTHSLEVAQIARNFARTLGANEDLAEVIALAHDLGHPPFGHMGEKAINLCIQEFAPDCNIKFDHNLYNFKLVTELETKFFSFNGINLTRATLEGLLKHNGSIKESDLHFPQFYYLRHFLSNVAPLDIGSEPCLEIKIANLSDDVAYNNHDIEDGLRANLFDFESLSEVPMLKNFVNEVVRSGVYKAPNKKRIHGELKRFVYNVLCADLLSSYRKTSTFNFSEKTEDDLILLRKFLMDKMYMHYKIMRTTIKAQGVIEYLFKYFFNNPSALPETWSVQYSNVSDRIINISDFIAGMTDKYALQIYEDLRF